MRYRYYYTDEPITPETALRKHNADVAYLTFRIQEIRDELEKAQTELQEELQRGLIGRLPTTYRKQHRVPESDPLFHTLPPTFSPADYVGDVEWVNLPDNSNDQTSNRDPEGS